MLLSDISCGLEKLPIPIENVLDDGLPTDFEYTPSCVPSALLPMEDFEIQYCGCKCQPSSGNICQSNDCSCVQVKNYGNANFHNRKLRETQGIKIPVFECNDECLCSEECPNRVVQNGISCKLSVFKSNLKGWCLRTLQPIVKGTFVCEYAGEILSYLEARERIQSQTQLDSNYIHVLNEHFGDNVTTTYIDPTSCGNVGRFANHSCEPNLKMQPIRVNNAIPKLALFAARDVEMGEELNFDYSGNDTASLANLSHEYLTRKRCACAARHCKKYLPFDSTLFH